MCQLVYDKEQTIQEEILLKFNLLFKKHPSILEQLESSPLPLSITTISDFSIRARLIKQYYNILQRAKDDLLNIYVEANRCKRLDCEKICHLTMSEIWQTQGNLPSQDRLTSRMLSVIEDRQKNIIDYMKSIYDLMGNLIQFLPTTRKVVV